MGEVLGDFMLQSCYRYEFQRCIWMDANKGLEHRGISVTTMLLGTKLSAERG